MMRQPVQRITGMRHLSRRCWLSVCLSGSAAGFLFNSQANAHKFYFSSTLVELNPETQSFEITVRLSADDLEMVLAERAKRKIEIDRSPDAEELTFAYIRDVLRLRAPNMQILALSWVGLETKVDTVYCYLEAAAPSTGLRDLGLSHALFFELQTGQTNIVSFRQQGSQRPHDLVFRAGDRFKVVIFPAEETNDLGSTETSRPHF